MVIRTMNRCYQSRNPLARTNPLRSMPFYRAPGAIVPMTDLDMAKWKLDQAMRFLPTLEAGYAGARAALGQANKVRGPMRRFWQAKAMRALNQARAQLRATRKQLAEAQIAVLLATPEARAA